ncbi:hydantoinase B/oxoprolinase family protein [Roseovarius arcticus]|uniref:hydantoinase B/oxoprolinase family protein n=1 Tax=Roseovarius arcticus TaxID=2547404 RepID=UPI001BB2871E|nr:hydantoinase B/oxoprolinase family protein [Roseovarius arcticus]
MTRITEDPILVSIIQRQLDHISLQMGLVMTRTARSPIFSQSHDFSCFLSNAHGETVAQADGIPIHTGGGGFAVRAVLRDFADQIFPDDVFILSDPYVAGGNHLPDWTVIRPVFVDDRLFGFCTNRAHQSDIGGGAAGTYNSAATEIFHEGIRLPVLKLVDKGQLRQDLWNLLLLNSRSPDLLDGDLGAMLGSTRIGTERFQALILHHGSERSARCLEAVLDYGERSMRQAISSLPNGSWTASDFSDTDCFETIEVETRVKITVENDSLIVDFTGSSPQVRGFKNSSVANTHSAVNVAIAAFFDESMPHNEGISRPVKIIAPEGTHLNALPPAAMTMNTIYPAGDIINACWKALAQIDQERACAGWGKISYSVSSGPDSVGRNFTLYHWHACAGGGAVRGRDGFPSISHQATLGGMVIPNVETYEQSYPCRIHQQEFRIDAAGAGTFRGGCGISYEIEVWADTQHSLRGEGSRKPSGFGVAEGLDGAKGEFHVFELDSGDEIASPQYGIQNLGPKRITIESSGGGGWGDPLKRDRLAVMRDVRDGIVSRSAAENLYGVKI